jgi:hypothetical protein
MAGENYNIKKKYKGEKRAVLNQNSVQKSMT